MHIEKRGLALTRYIPDVDRDRAITRGGGLGKAQGSSPPSPIWPMNMRKSANPVVIWQSYFVVRSEVKAIVDKRLFGNVRPYLVGTEDLKLDMHTK
jgi:hypothetical protein